MPRQFEKDLDSTEDYGIDWSLWLEENDTIDTSSWEAEDGIDIESYSFTTTSTTVWLSGGDVGTYYRITNHITTADGRADDRSIFVRVV